MHDVAANPHQEAHFQSTEVVRDVVIGLSDGLTVPFALAAGLSGVVASAHLVVLAGLAEIAAGSIAMGLGGYLAARGDAEHYASELLREQTEVVTRPNDEAEEIYEIFEQYGVPRDAATPVLHALQQNPPAYVDFMMRFELGLEAPAPNRAHRSALTIAASYVAGGLVPLLPYMVARDATAALRLSVLITLLALALFGALKGRLVGTGTLRSALQTVSIGGAAAAAPTRSLACSTPPTTKDLQRDQPLAASHPRLLMPIHTLALPTALLATRFCTVREATLRLVAPLSPEDMMVQSCPEASPVKWHLAHTSWFFETFVLNDFLSGYQPFHPDFHWLFNSYYNALGEMPEKKLRASFSRPPLADILAYRAHVDAAIARLLDGDATEEALRRITLGLEHEQQHQELIATDIKHALFTNPLHPAYLDQRTPAPGTSVPSQNWVHFAPGLTEIGVTPDPTAVDAFAFDNETPRHTIYIAPFALAARPVTCAEYLAFIDADGYIRPELWLAEGWTTMRNEGWQAPLYWQRDPAAAIGWSIYTMAGFQPLEALSDASVCHLSFFEADAYARWAGHRLPTEFEWEYAATSSTLCHPERSEAQSKDLRFSSPAIPRGNFVESGRLHPTPANPNLGLQQLFGDVWEWTSSGYTGYPGYRPLPGALGEYNGKFMSSQVILRGGSCVTPATHIRPTYRNFFGPATRWQFSGLRLAKDAAAPRSTTTTLSSSAKAPIVSS